MGSRRKKYLEKFGSAVTFAPVLYFLIKKGRGIWPDEALATVRPLVWKGANSSPVHAGKDKSDYSSLTQFK
jgi:hypothetical protein